MIPALVMGGLSLAGGLLSSKSSKKAQKEANAIARETLNFNNSVTTITKQCMAV